MTDGTISTIISLVVGLLATSVAAVVVTRADERERRRVHEHEALALRDAGLRTEHHILESKLWDLRAEVAELQRQRAHLVGEVEAAASGRDPAPAVAARALMRAQTHHHEELARRLQRAGDAQVIPFPFLPPDG